MTPDVTGLLLITLSALGAQGQDLYEEDPAASAPVRAEAYHQLIGYVDSLAAAETPLSPLWTPEYGSIDAYAASTAPLVGELRARMGYPSPGALAEPSVRREQVAEDDVATYSRMWIQVFEGVELYSLFIVPKGIDSPAPLVITQHGGGGTPEVATFAGGANYHDMVRGAVSEGYVAWAPALVFNTFGDGELLPQGIRSLLDARARRAGTTLAAVEITAITTALTAVLRQPEVTPERVGMVGLSYGGFYTLYTTALEPRIKVAVSSCFFNDRASVLAAAEPHGWEDMSYLGAGRLIDDADVAALICPRPLQVQVGVSDDLFPVEGARAAAPKARRHWEELGLGDRFEFIDAEGTHEWFGPPAWSFLRKWL
ncbi:MAG: dienelactone hydrolase family protein [Acidobacteriota bacterium]|nr:dienelactone hydrolase family protein [Acidobacteriota bacterium]